MLLCLIKVDFKMLFYRSLIFYIFLEVDNTTCKLVKLCIKADTSNFNILLLINSRSEILKDQ